MLIILIGAFILGSLSYAIVEIVIRHYEKKDKQEKEQERE